jgi:hypothetical protein
MAGGGGTSPNVCRERKESAMARKRKKEEYISLQCGANKCPGLDWQAEIRLVEKRPGYYLLYHTDTLREQVPRARLCGGPPWRLISTYLNTIHKFWHIYAGAPEEFCSTGLEGWQEAAIFISWLRAGGGTVNHGLEFRCMSDDEVQKLCKPYSDKSDWRGSHILKLWEDLDALLFMASENGTIRSSRLKDILTQLTCWDSPDPMHAAIDYMVRHESADACSN